MKPAKDPNAVLLEKTAREFARKTLLPDIFAFDRFPHGPFFHDAMKIAHESDFLHIYLPEKFNGMGRKLVPLCILLQQIAETDASMAAIILCNAASQELMLAAGEEDRLAEMISTEKGPREALIALPLFTHPGEKMLDVAAAPSHSGYELSGTAQGVALGTLAGRCLIPARTTGGYAYFLIDTTTDDGVFSAPVKGLGLHACPVADATLSKISGILMGKENSGAEIFGRMLEKMMIAAAAAALGIMKSSFKDALAYASKRRQGGRKIIEWSGLEAMLGEMAIKTKTAEMLLQKAMEDADAGLAGWAEHGYAAACRILSDACAVTSMGMQVFGGYGYMRDYLPEKRYRDSRHLQTVFGMPGRRYNHFLKRIK